MRGPRPVWRGAVVAAAMCALAVHLAGAPSAVRMLVVFSFLAICPGMAFVRLLRLADPLAEGTLAVALSVSLAALVSEGLAIAQLWSPTGSLALLAGLTAVGAALPLPSPRPGQLHPTRYEEAQP